MDDQTLADFGTFSDPAKSTIRIFIFDYARNLVRAAVVVKDRVRGDSVSAANVQEAYVDLHKHDPQERNGFAKLAGVLGGVLFGTGLSTLASMIQDDKFTLTGTVLAVVTVAVGAFLIALELPEGLWRKRKSPNSP